MFLVGYVSEKKIRNIEGKVSLHTKACGFGKDLGIGIGKNKGGMQLSFQYNDKFFNFIGCHLVHGQDTRVGRDLMMEEIIATFRTEREEFDADIFCDYNFILGDLNYRIDSSFEEMKSRNEINTAFEYLEEWD